MPRLKDVRNLLLIAHNSHCFILFAVSLSIKTSISFDVVDTISPVTMFHASLMPATTISKLKLYPLGNSKLERDVASLAATTINKCS